MMNASADCSSCGEALPRTTVGGLCPRCLVGRLFDSDTLEEAEEAADGLRLGNFVVGEKLGEGGSGIVYRARQIEPVKRDAAVKILKADDERALARFEAETQALALLDHPNIARFFDAGITDEGQAFVAMELIEGREIHEHCAEEKLTTEERVRLLQSVAEAVQSGHAQGIVHRDLKPPNVLVDASGEPKVIDFGIARASERLLTETTLLTAGDELLGTPDYLSPEQAAGGKDIDARSDVHALGAILYELLSGDPPFGFATRGVGLAQALDEIRHREPAPPPGPNELRLIALKALSKEPERRYADGGEFAADIGRLLDGKPVRARPPSLAYRAGKLVRRHKLASAAIALASLAMVVGSVVSSVMAVRAKRAAIETSRAFAQSDFHRATQLMLANDQDHAVAFLCRGLRENPGDRIALRQLMLLLTTTDFPQPIAELPIGNGNQLSIAISENGKVGVVEEAGKKVTFFDIQNPAEPRRSIDLPGFARVLATIPQENKVAVAADGVGLCVLDYATAAHAVEIYPEAVNIHHAAPSMDGGPIVLAGRNKLQVLDWKNGRALWQKEMKATIVGIDLTPDSQLIAVLGSDGIFHLLRAENGEPSAPPRAFGNRGTAVKFSPDGCQCAVAVGPGREGREGVVHLLELVPGDGRPERILPVGGDPYSIEFVCGGSHMLITPEHGYSANLWDLKNGRMVARTPAIHQAVFGTGVALADGSRVFTADRSGIVRQWEGESMKPTAAPFRMGSHCDRLISTADSQRLIAHDVNGHVQIWDTRHRAIPIRFFSRRGIVSVARLNQSGNRLATVSGDGYFRLWDTGKHQPILEMKTGDSQAVADFDWQSRVLALGLPDGRVRSFHLTGEEKIETCGEWKLDSRIWLVRVSGGGKVAAGSDTGEVGIFSPATEETTMAELDRRHLEGWVTAAAWSETEALAVGTSLGDAALWRGGEFVGQLEHPSSDKPRKLHDFAFSESGTRLAALRRDGHIQVWNVQEMPVFAVAFDHGSHARNDFFQIRQRLQFGGSDTIYSLSCYDNRTRSWDLESSKQRWEGVPQRYVGHSLALNDATGEVVSYERLSITDAESGRQIASDLDLTFGDGDHPQGLSFSSDGRYLAVPGGWGSTRLHTFPAMPEFHADEWFLRFAEHWVGARVGEDGRVKILPVAERQVGIGKDCPDGVPSRQRAIAEWLCAPVEVRAVAPGETMPMRDALDALAVQADARAARSALWYRPGDPLAMLTLAGELLRSYPYPVMLPMAEFYARAALDSDSPEIRQRASKLLEGMQ